MYKSGRSFSGDGDSGGRARDVSDSSDSSDTNRPAGDDAESPTRSDDGIRPHLRQRTSQPGETHDSGGDFIPPHLRQNRKITHPWDMYDVHGDFIPPHIRDMRMKASLAGAKDRFGIRPASGIGRREGLYASKQARHERLARLTERSGASVYDLW